MRISDWSSDVCSSDLDDLVAHAVEHMFHERYEEFLGLLDVGDPRAAIAKFFDGYLSMAHRGHPETGCPIPSLSSELGHLSEDGRGRLSRGMRGLRSEERRVGKEGVSTCRHRGSPK